MAEYDHIQAQIIDSDLFSGSVDSFRTAFGGYYTTVDVEATDENDAGTALEFVDPISDSEYWHPDFDGHGGLEPYELKAVLDLDLIETIDEEVLVANRKMPMRVYSDSDLIVSDIFWKTLWIGGEFDEVSYSPIFNETIHSYYTADYDLPYPQIEANAFSSEDIANVIEISYDYSAYLPQYQNYISKLDSELLIPSYYLMYNVVANEHDLSDADGAQLLYSDNLINYITAEGSYPDILNFFDFNESTIPDGFELSDYDDKAAMLEAAGIGTDFVTRNSYLATDFLTASYIQTPLSASTVEWAKDRMQNLLFDKDAVGDLFAGGTEFSTNAAMLPYKIKINFNEYEGSSGEFSSDSSTTIFADSIRENNFSSKFIKTLYQAFGNKVEELAPNEVSYVTSLNYSSASLEDEIEYTNSTANSVSYREIDYVNFLAYCYNNYISSEEGCLLVGPKTLERLSAIDTDGTYRHFNTKAALGTLTDAVEYLANTTNISIESLNDIYTNSTTYIEPVAYRVEKIGGPPTGDSFTQNTLQNFWFFKPEPPDFDTGATFTFYDNQVKYDTDYTYKVYAYALMVGYRYKFSDLALTRQIGCEGVDGEYGLEFYDPYSDDEGTTSRLYEGSATDNTLVSEYSNVVTQTSVALIEEFDTLEAAELAGGYFVGLGDDETVYSYTITENYNESDGLFDGTRTLTVIKSETITTAGSEYGTDAQIFSTAPYVADFYLNYEPTIKLVEIPLYEKTLKVMDNPTNKLSVVPYQVIGDSQQIGFDFVYTSFVENTFPSVIDDADEEYKESYISANDLFENSYIEFESIAKQRYVEVYRLSSRPTAITDFKGAKIAEIDLAIEDLSQYSYKGAFYDDTIKTNQKYYYLFRILNQQRVLSHLTEITEAELINDGGYKYTVFNTLYEYELEQEVFNNPTEEFKKLIQLQPNLDQLMFNTDDIDYNEAAATQIGNLVVGASEDSIWDKTFKVRLTSKKTSRKIDLNITYRLNSD